MSNEAHYRKLERMYNASPINTFYKPTLTVEEGFAKIEMDVHESFFHSARAVHGAVYFKLLDDAAWFAANSLETEVFLLTTSFTTYITRPISSGVMHVEGEVVNMNKSQFIAESVVYDENDYEIARGSGIFVRGKTRLEDAMGYE